MCTNGAHDSAGPALAFPRGLVRFQEAGPARLTWVPGLAEVLQQCYAQGVLPSEANVSWARPGRKVELRDYRHFPGGAP